MLTKVDRKSKPIKKHAKICSKLLQNRNIDLEDENFDIIKYINDEASIKEK